MWIATTRGFFSAVAKDGPDTIVVRARVRGDLENLLPLLGEATIVDGGGTDYPFRVRISRSTWKQALGVLADEIDYGNFKDAVRRPSGPCAGSGLPPRLGEPSRSAAKHDLNEG